MLYLLSLFAAALEATASALLIDESLFHPSDIITKSIALIGGGASGTYAATRLHDLNTSLILIERDDHLSGHVNTYTIPNTNTTIEYGVQTYMRYGPAEAFFARMGVGIAGQFSPRLSTNVNVDIGSGQIMESYMPPSGTEATEALEKWVNYTQQYTKFLDPGYWDFPAPSDIPADLLLPFEKIAKEYGFEAAVPRMMSVANVGLGGIKDLLTLYVVMAYGYPVAQGTLDNSYFVPEGSNSLIYQRAYELLKPDVFLSSTITEAERTESGVKLVVTTGDGQKKLIKAKKVLISAPPSLDNMAPFDLDEKEHEVYDTWTGTWSFVGVAKVPCIPENNSLTFLPASAAPNDYLSTRDYPFSLRFDSTGPVGGKLFRVIFGTNYSISHDDAKATVQSTLQKAVDTGTIGWEGKCEPEYKAWVDHNSILWQNNVELIKSGFVQKLYGLQGWRNTWYTGLTWCGHFSSNVWAFTDTVLPRILKEL